MNATIRQVTHIALNLYVYIKEKNKSDKEKTSFIAHLDYL